MGRAERGGEGLRYGCWGWTPLNYDSIRVCLVTTHTENNNGEKLENDS